MRQVEEPISSFLQGWKDISLHLWFLQMLESYIPCPSNRWIPLYPFPLLPLVNWSSPYAAAEVAALVKKRAVELLSNQEIGRAATPCISLFPRCSAVLVRFKTLGFRTCSSCSEAEYWMISVDLHDVQFHILILQSQWSYLRSVVGSGPYELEVLLITTRDFNKEKVVIAAHLRWLGTSEFSDNCLLKPS